jgi:flagellar motility protein MotE (MotC chaperone)
MKSIVIISTLTFLVIFGIIMFTNGLFQSAVRDLNQALESESETTDKQATDMIFANLAAARDRLQRESEAILALQTTYDVEDKLLADREEKVAEMIAELSRVQAAHIRNSDAQAAKLSKVYEAMKPTSAAPILSSLDMDIVLQILSNMKDRQAAKILANMNPGLAAEISTRMSAKGHG